jgi:Fungal Zn(2)-Cys(6) binuclear cluster domain
MILCGADKVRIRRIKCDETKPRCQKCTSSGRECEGPLTPRFKFVQINPSISRSASFTPKHNELERRAFEFIRHCGVPNGESWGALVLQLSQTYDFVWDIVLSLSLLLEHVAYVPPNLGFELDDGRSPKAASREHRQAIKLYSRSIESVRKLTDYQSEPVDNSIIALGYILFASVEFQLGNASTAKDLLQRCVKLVVQNLNSLTTRNSVAANSIYQAVTPFVMRKAVVTATLGNGISEDYLRTLPSQSPFLRAFQIKLYDLVDQSFELIRHAEFLPQLGEEHYLKIIFLSKRQSLLNELAQWRIRFIGSETTGMESGCISPYLIMYWAVAYISLATCVTSKQTIFDNYTDEFITIIDNAQLYLNAISCTGLQLSHDVPEPGLLPLLYFCATKCRQPALRREALRLMRLMPSRDAECAWVFVAPDQVVAKIICLEEGIKPGFLPPENQRFAHISVIDRQDPGGGKRGLGLELTRYEAAEDGSARFLTEQVWLDDEGHV